MSSTAAARPLFDPAITRWAILASVRKLNPLHLLRNPVMFVVWVGSLLTTILGILAASGHLAERAGFILAIAAWLWLTVLFANFAEAMAEGRGRAQADTLRKARADVNAKKLRDPAVKSDFANVPASTLRKGDIVWSTPERWSRAMAR